MSPGALLSQNCNYDGLLSK